MSSAVSLHGEEFPDFYKIPYAANQKLVPVPLYGTVSKILIFFDKINISINKLHTYPVFLPQINAFLPSRPVFCFIFGSFLVACRSSASGTW